MKPGKRVELIKELSKKLAEYEWEDIDLILRQFGLPWSETWGGDSVYNYCLRHIEEGNDQQLLELREFLLVGGDETKAEISSLTGPWKPQRFRLFASHIHFDKSLVSKVKTALEFYGIDTFVAHEDIEPTQEWMNEIEAALGSCDAIAAFLTSDFQKSPWADQEIGFCVNRRVLLLPLKLDIDPYGFMGKYQALPCKGLKPEELSRHVFDILIKHDLTKERMAEGLIGRFEDSLNFDDANRVAILLRQIVDWTPERLRRLENAPKVNNQVSGAWTAKNVISSIIQDSVNDANVPF